MLLAERVEDAACAGEVGGVAAPHVVDLNGVGADQLTLSLGIGTADANDYSQVTIVELP